MSTRSRSAIGSLVLTTGEAVVYGCSFVRNIILARILTKTDFGIAAAFALIITLFELSAKLGISRLVIQDNEGDEPDFLATAHLVQGAAAGASALLMVVAAWPLSRLFGISEHIAALLMLACVPLLTGFAHLDVKRFERGLRFGPSTWAEVLPQLGITLATWPVATWLGDYRAVVVLLVAKAACTCFASHWLAEQPYRWTMHRDYARRMVLFGWPLLITGFLMFGVLQGDQILVATFYRMDDLGPYAAAAALTVAPTFFFARVFNSIALPLMAAVQGNRPTFERRYRLIIGVIGVFSTVHSVGMIVGAESLMQLAYGKRYAGSGLILGWLAAANSLRNIRMAPALGALALGDSMNQLMSNLARVTALLPALAVALAGQPLWMVAGTGLLGEALACVVSFTRLSRRHHLPLAINLPPTGLVLSAVVLAGTGSHLMAGRLSPSQSLFLAVLVAAVSGVLVVLLLGDTRRELLHLRHQLRTVRWREWMPIPRRRTRS